MYGVRACRTRTTPSGATEPEPILHFFWRATHHGVPLEERLPPSDFALYIDLLSGVANAVGDEHTLNCKGAAAFWNIYGSMQECVVARPRGGATWRLAPRSLRHAPCAWGVALWSAPVMASCCLTRGVTCAGGAR
jgi:hypothetical protein